MTDDGTPYGNRRNFLRAVGALGIVTVGGTASANEGSGKHDDR